MFQFFSNSMRIKKFIKKLSLLTFIIILLGSLSDASNFANSRKNSIDSLLLILDNTKGYKRIEILTSLAELNKDENPEESSIYAFEAVRLSKNSGDKLAEASASKTAGLLYYHSNNYDDAQEFYNFALKIYEKHNMLKEQAELYFLKGDAFYSLKEYEKAIVNHKKGTSIYSTINDSALTGEGYAKLGKDYMAGSDYDYSYFIKAETEFENALRIFKSSNLLYSYADVLYDFGNLRLLQGKNNEAMQMFDESLSKYIQLGDQSKAAIMYNNIGNIRFNIGDLTGAEQDYKKAMEINNRNKNNNIAESYYNLSKVYYFYAYNTDWGYRNYQKPMEYSKKAYNYLKRYIDIKDSTTNAAYIKRFTESLLRSKSQEMQRLQSDTTSKGINLVSTAKQLELERLEVENLRLWIFVAIIAFLLVGLVAYGIYNRYRFKKEHNEELQKVNLELETTNSKLMRSEKGLRKSNEEKDYYLKIINSDLEKAATYVLSLIPSLFNEKGISAEWKFKPSTHIGGDLFGYHWVDQDNFAFYLLDVSGHGVGPALHAVSAANMIRTASLRKTNYLRPASVMKALNSNFPMVDYYFMYFTMWYAVYNVNTHILSYATAGHPPAVIIDASGNTKLLETQNIFIGADPDMEFVDQVMLIDSDSTIYVFSDGAYEIKQTNGEMLPINEFYKMLEASSHHSKDAIENLYQKVVSIKGEEKLDDDFSMLKIRIKV